MKLPKKARRASPKASGRSTGCVAITRKPSRISRQTEPAVSFVRGGGSGVRMAATLTAEKMNESASKKIASGALIH